MAPKRSFRDEPPSASSSSSETEVEVDEEEEAGPQEEEEEEEDPQEEEEEEQEEEEEEEEGGGGNDKPLASSRTLLQKNTEPQSADSDTESEPDRETIHRAAKPNGQPAPVKPEGKKRGAEEAVSNGQASKRVKTESSSGAANKQLFQRIWSESDEMEVMKGLIEFSDWKKDNPVHDSNDLYEFIRKRLQSSVTKRQLRSKIQNLKKRFCTLEKRASKGAKLKLQEEAFLEMSRKIWDSDSAGKTAEKTFKKEKTMSRVLERREEGSVSESYNWFLKEITGFSRGGAVDVEFVRKGMDMIDEKKKAEFDKRWRRLQMEELEIVLERARLIQEQAALIGQAYKSLGS